MLRMFCVLAGYCNFAAGDANHVFHFFVVRDEPQLAESPPSA